MMNRDGINHLPVDPSFSSGTTLRRQADGRLIAPVVEDQPLLPSITLLEDDMDALQLRQEIKDEQAKSRQLEWFLHEIMAERDVLLRQHEDQARRHRQEELLQLNRHLLRHSASESCLSALSAPAVARPRSTSAPAAMVSSAPPEPIPHHQHLPQHAQAGRLQHRSLSPVNTPAIRPAPIAAVAPAGASPQAPLGGSAHHNAGFGASCDMAARLLGLAPEDVAAAAANLADHPRPAQLYPNPPKRARFAAAAAQKPPPQSQRRCHHRAQPSRGAGQSHPHHTSISANDTPCGHTALHQPIHGASGPSPIGAGAGCESPVGGSFATPPQCMESVSFAARPLLQLPLPMTPFESAGSASEWPPLTLEDSASGGDKFNSYYDELLDSLTSSDL